jgi:hypothetical protein
VRDCIKRRHFFLINLAVSVLATGAPEGKEESSAQEVDVNERPEFKGGIYNGTGYIQDGNITTVGICPLASRSLNLPDGTKDLTKGFIASLKKEE